MSVVDLNEPVARGWGATRSKSVGWHDYAILRGPPRDLSEFWPPPSRGIRPDATDQSCSPGLGQ
jgi:hypothetical protein